jgi:precorrin-6B methylase 2
MRHLVTAGLLRDDGTGQYALTELGELLRDDHPAAMRRRLDLEGAIGRADLAFVQLLHTVRTGDVAYSVEFGRSFWEDLAKNPALSASFDDLMGGDMAIEAPVIVAAFDWGSLGHVVDVGGGNGSLLIAMLRQFPMLRGTVVDLPGATDTARRVSAAARVAERTEIVTGSFFDALPSNAGGYILSAIIHNWADGAAREILRRCAQAAGDRGHVFIIERADSRQETVRTDRDLRMLVYFGGRERSVAELIALANEADLDVVAVHEAAPNVIVELGLARTDHG